MMTLSWTELGGCDMEPDATLANNVTATIVETYDAHLAKRDLSACITDNAEQDFVTDESGTAGDHGWGIVIRALIFGDVVGILNA